MRVPLASLADCCIDLDAVLGRFQAEFRLYIRAWSRNVVQDSATRPEDSYPTTRTCGRRHARVHITGAAFWPATEGVAATQAGSRPESQLEPSWQQPLALTSLLMSGQVPDSAVTPSLAVNCFQRSSVCQDGCCKFVFRYSVHAEAQACGHAQPGSVWRTGQAHLLSSRRAQLRSTQATVSPGLQEGFCLVLGSAGRHGHGAAPGSTGCRWQARCHWKGWTQAGCPGRPGTGRAPGPSGGLQNKAA